jgi:hypothetical protein
MPVDYVEFYPSQEYIDKNWAPVKVPLNSFKSLAKSQAIAEKQGILSPETTKYYLPSALTEGRFDDYGVNQVDVNYGTAMPKKARDADLVAQDYLGQLNTLNSYMQANPKTTKNWGPTIQAVGREMKKYSDVQYDDRVWSGNERQVRLRKVADALGIGHLASQEVEADAKYDRYNPRNTESQDERAAIKTLALANKYHEAGGKAHGLKLWEMYNGAGPKAREYVGKLKHTDEMMLHPANKDMYNAYLKLVDEHKKSK